MHANENKTTVDQPEQGMHATQSNRSRQTRAIEAGKPELEMHATQSNRSRQTRARDACHSEK